MAVVNREVWRNFFADEYDAKLAELGARLEKLWRERGFEEPEIRLRLLVEEAVNNAWEHGNRRDPSKRLTITWCFDPDFHFSVEDEGAGFNLASVGDPSGLENRTRARGRGIFLIRHYSDEAHWENSGRRLHMRLAPTPKKQGDN